MYKKINRLPITSLKTEPTTQGETIEQKINRIVNNKEPITDGAPIIYTERKDGVQPQYDIRTDRFELAVEATDHLTKQKLANREKGHEGIKIDKPNTDGNTKGDSKGNDQNNSSNNTTGSNQTPEAK